LEIVVTAVGPDNVGLADPIIHDLTSRGANIDEIQMYNHDDAAVFAMLCRVHVTASQFGPIKEAMAVIGQRKQLEVRVWSPEERQARPRLAICTTFLEAPARALLQSIRDGKVVAEPAVLIGNR
jgi:formyltetrahydrofolate deformylase